VYFGSFSFETYDLGYFLCCVMVYLVGATSVDVLNHILEVLRSKNMTKDFFLLCCVVVYLVCATSFDVSNWIMEAFSLKRRT
jgi:hypothetical protein